MENQNDTAPLIRLDEESQLLTETVWATLQRDLNDIKTKILIVVNPKASSDHALRDWDLWGPLLLCLFLSVVLSITAPPGQTTLLFTGVFSIVTFGAGIVTINMILLGGTVGFFQALCALGYCLFPIAVSSLITAILPFFIFKITVVPACLAWAVYSANKFFSSQIPENRKYLGLYPCCLLYAVLSWIIFIH
ncbi:Yip1 domain containing protein [Tritrichomonas foetus]|uniref:Protein YIPF n=1 Tax=Tritrichomonas foetus TaxID=1144522 RepID=A0A1J4JHL0_9EUKA|nr:Yip1 domain containing protein [Tritrichomonas foetus]|eukprot:OHS97735.1 Yip1 domain containing protein [Tritrichomonas foetus]